MLHKLLVPFLALAGLFHTHSDAYSRMVSKVEMSVVRITGEMDRESFEGIEHGTYTCTGEVIAVGKVITAAHCIGTSIKTDLDEIQLVIKKDEKLDLALLATNTHQKPSLKLRTVPVARFETLTAIGYAWGYKGLTVLSERAFLLNAAPWTDSEEEGIVPGLIVQGGYIGGMSGGPVVDAKGLQVSIVQRGDGFVGYGINAKIIADFLAGVQ